VVDMGREMGREDVLAVGEEGELKVSSTLLGFADFAESSSSSFSRPSV